ncbi:MAG: hypothetical protein RIC57_09240 [Balneola sp.]
MPTAENELIYVVRINTEGETELVQTGKILNKNDDSFKQTEKSVKKYRSSLKELAAQQAKNGGSTASFNKRNSSASNLLIELSRGASDAQYGIRGLGNNLEQAANIGAQAYKHFGSFGGLIRGIGASMLGPTGIVVGITAITTGLGLASAGVFDFGKKTKDFASDSEEMLNKLRKINSELSKLKELDSDSFFSTEGDLDSLRRLSVIEEDVKDQIRRLESLRSAENLTTGQLRVANVEGRINEGRDGRIISVDLSDEDKESLKQYEADLESLGEEISSIEEKIARTERLKQYPTVLAAEWERAVLNAEKYNKETDDLIKKLDQDIAGLDTDLPEHEADPNGESEAIQKRKEQQLQEQGRARLQFEKTIDQMRLASLRASGNEHVLLAAEEQQKIDEIKNNELITAMQRKEALQLIEQEYSNKRINLAKKEAEEKERLDQKVAQARYNLEGQSLQALYALKEGFFASNKGIAIAMLALEKGLAIAQAIKSGALASGEAQLLAAKYTAASITPLGPNPLAIAGAANAQAQVANIARITGLTVAAIGAQAIGQGASILTSSSGNNGFSSAPSSSNYTSYRGFDTSAPTFSNPEPSSRPRNDEGQSSDRTRGKESREIRITNGFGNLVLLGQEEIDASGGSDYLRGGI